jgi:hypothetical protein
MYHIADLCFHRRHSNTTWVPSIHLENSDFSFASCRTAFLLVTTYAIPHRTWSPHIHQLYTPHFHSSDAQTLSECSFVQDHTADTTDKSNRDFQDEKLSWMKKPFSVDRTLIFLSFLFQFFNVSIKTHFSLNHSFLIYHDFSIYSAFCFWKMRIFVFYKMILYKNFL